MPPASSSGAPRPDLLSPNHGNQAPLPRRLSEISDARSKNTSPVSANDFSSPGYSSAIMSDASTDTARKRKRSLSPSERQSKQVKLGTEEAPRAINVNVRGYLAELNRDIWDAAEGIRFELPRDSADTRESNLGQSQIGGTIWSEDDKERFFNALAIYGKDDTVSIAAAIGNGIGPIQVREYLTVLADASIEYKKQIGPRRWNRIMIEDQPAAVDIGKELFHALSEAAAKLEDRCLRLEEKEEIRKWGKYWRLDHDIAEQVKEQYELEDEENKPKTRIEVQEEEEQLDGAEDEDMAGEDDQAPDIKAENADDHENIKPLVYNSIPSAQLLHLPNFLRLSRHVYMNFPQHRIRPWQAGGPAIRQTALSDFHNLVVSVTRRVIGMVLFQSEIRIRNLRPPGRQGRLVRPIEILAALDILGMPTGSHDYWVNIPRRYKLRLTIPSRRLIKFEKKLQRDNWSLEDAEALLKQSKRSSAIRVADVESDGSNGEPGRGDIDDGDVTMHEGRSEGIEDEETMQTMINEEIEHIGGLSESEDDDVEAEEMKTVREQGLEDDDSSDDYQAGSASESSSDDENMDDEEAEDAVDDMAVDNALIDPRLQSWGTVGDAMELGVSNVELDQKNRNGDSSASAKDRPRFSPEKKVRFEIEDDEEEEGEDDEDILEEQIGSGHLTRDDLLAIYPVVFDSLHVTTSQKVLTKQLKIVRDIILEEKEEDDYLEAKDQRQNEREEQRLWRALIDDHKGPAFAYSQAIIKEDTDEKESLKLGSRAAAEWASGRPGDWRDHTEYVAEWERPLTRSTKP